MLDVFHFLIMKLKQQARQTVNGLRWTVKSLRLKYLNRINNAFYKY